MEYSQALLKYQKLKKERDEKNKKKLSLGKNFR